MAADDRLLFCFKIAHNSTYNHPLHKVRNGHFRRKHSFIIYPWKILEVCSKAHSIYRPKVVHKSEISSSVIPSWKQNKN